ncbi:AbrB/MazE/SpoVT family DNA-binding domain-containing protein [Chlorobium sp. N1]|uniref:AbrB/MazE/SpoVT family DNA-binding domain-containing protein n=1 Tax=Chlorobium sp. N1 TaxID=2491138 RepID=UPI00103D319F|nr:AbrB/MazE/SpoVT family DNA-binding domain-containing protein [Chlorobium sp. N1]TCD47491.1 AbrB/MazE/SpoVT family DNA-binding domain-containing protein [Chlorobium sp. N1]
METTRITEKGQVTVPVRIRKAAGLRKGDTLEVGIEGKSIIMTKITPQADPYLICVEESLSEWYGKEDEEAWSGL